MKRVFGIVAALALLSSSVALAGIADSKHNLVIGSGGSQTITGLTAICEPCHTPHADAVQDAPLWNHAVTETSFTTYTTVRDSTSDAVGASKLCLGCHDGATAMDNYGGVTTGTQDMTASYAIIGAGDLSKNHPIGITYTEIADNYAAISAVTGAGLRLPGGNIECQSCHDPHDETLKTGSTVMFLRMANDASQLCTTCHTL